VSTAWQVPLSVSLPENKTTFNGFFNEEGDFRKVAQTAIEWMSKYVAPHELVSVSMIQADMDEGKDVMISVGHNSGENPEEIG